MTSSPILSIVFMGVVILIFFLLIFNNIFNFELKSSLETAKAFTFGLIANLAVLSFIFALSKVLGLKGLLTIRIPITKAPRTTYFVVGTILVGWFMLVYIFLIPAEFRPTVTVSLFLATSALLSYVFSSNRMFFLVAILFTIGFLVTQVITTL